MPRRKQKARNKQGNNASNNGEKIKEANTRINNLQKQVKEVRKKVYPERPVNRGFIAQIPRLNMSKWNVSMLMSHYSASIYNYLMALLHPELCVQGSLSAKQPNFTPIPTTTVTFKEQFSFVTDSNGEFRLVWIPNFFSNLKSCVDHVKAMAKKIQTSNIWTDTVKNNVNQAAYAHLVLYRPQESALKSKFLYHSSYLPDISLTKYRLVSAKLSVEYVGPKIQKGGMMYSCATYKDLPVIIQGSDTIIPEDFETVTNDAMVAQTDKYKLLFDQENINNGLWNKYTNVAGQGVRLDNIALPTDPTDSTFFPLTHYYASEPIFTTYSSQVNPASVVGVATSTDGGHLSYVVSGNGLHGSGNQGGAPINVFVYYNFEVIAAQDTAPFLRTSKDQKQPKLMEILDKNKTKVTNFLVNEMQRTRLDPSSSKWSIKRFASSMVREISKAGLNMLPGNLGSWALPLKGFI